VTTRDEIAYRRKALAAKSETIDRIIEHIRQLDDLLASIEEDQTGHVGRHRAGG